MKVTSGPARFGLAALFIANAAAAQTQVQFYGVIDVAVGQMAGQEPGPPTAGVTKVKGVYNGGVTTSYIGLRGTEDLGGGLAAKFQLEGFVRVDTGESGRFNANPGSAADPFWSRDSYAGIAGGFGELRLGVNGNPMWLATLPVSALGGNSRFSPMFRQLFNSGTRGRSVIDTAMVNSVRYVLPALGGFSGSVALQAGEGRGSRYNYAANAGYRADALTLSAGLQSARHQPVPSLNAAALEQDMWVVGGSWNFGFLRLVLGYAEVDNGSNKSKIPQFGLTAPIGDGTLQFGTGQDRNTVNATGAKSKRETTSLGYLYPMSRRTDLYVFAMTEKYPVVGPAKNSGDSLLAGIRHQF